MVIEPAELAWKITLVLPPGSAVGILLCSRKLDLKEIVLYSTFYLKP